MVLSFYWMWWPVHLLVFSICGLKQNARSLLTPVSDTVFNALSHGSLHFVLHGRFNNHLFQRFWLVVEKFWPLRKWLKATMDSKTKTTMWKSIKSSIRNRCQMWPCILFGATNWENKQWGSISFQMAEKGEIATGVPNDQIKQPILPVIFGKTK